jgi:hypothetical protein
METNRNQETIRQQIISDNNVRHLITSIEAMPDRIKKAKDAQTDTDFRVSTNNTVKLAQEEVARIEGELAYLIALETDDKGKKRFSNDSQRTQALKVACSRSDDWKAAVEELGHAERGAAEEKFGLAKAHNTLSHLYELQRANLGVAYLIGCLSGEDRALESLAAITRQTEVLNDIGKAINNLNKIEVTNNA